MSYIFTRILVSFLALAAMIIHLIKWHNIEFSWNAMALLLIAIVPWLPAFVDSFKFGKDSLEVKLREVEKKADAAIDASLRGTVKNPADRNPNPAPADDLSTEEPANFNLADPQKYQWGGSPAANDRLLSARIEKIPDEDFFRRVILRVESTDPAKPLSGKVTFHLHPTFKKQILVVPAIKNAAESSLVSYGAFTVGAEADNGDTKLELDLASLNDGKDQFFNR